MNTILPTTTAPSEQGFFLLLLLLLLLLLHITLAPSEKACFSSSSLLLLLLLLFSFSSSRWGHMHMDRQVISKDAILDEVNTHTLESHIQQFVRRGCWRCTLRAQCSRTACMSCCVVCSTGAAIPAS